MENSVNNGNVIIKNNNNNNIKREEHNNNNNNNNNDHNNINQDSKETRYKQTLEKIFTILNNTTMVSPTILEEINKFPESFPIKFYHYRTLKSISKRIIQVKEFIKKKEQFKSITHAYCNNLIKWNNELVVLLGKEIFFKFQNLNSQVFMNLTAFLEEEKKIERNFLENVKENKSKRDVEKWKYILSIYYEIGKLYSEQ
jgi:hypothetical protein